MLRRFLLSSSSLISIMSPAMIGRAAALGLIPITNDAGEVVAWGDPIVMAELRERLSKPAG